MQAEETIAAREDLVAIVKPQSHRLIRRFIVETDPGNVEDSRVSDAFWDLVYWGIEEVDYQTACEVELELSKCDRKVSELIFGEYKLEALKLFEGAQS